MRFKKGSAAAKAFMARLRGMQKRKKNPKRRAKATTAKRRRPSSSAKAAPRKARRSLAGTRAPLRRRRAKAAAPRAANPARRRAASKKSAAVVLMVKRGAQRLYWKRAGVFDSDKGQGKRFATLAAATRAARKLQALGRQVFAVSA